MSKAASSSQGPGMQVDQEKVARIAMILLTAGPNELLQAGVVEECDTFTKEEWLYLVGLLSGNLKEFIDNSDDPERWRSQFAKRLYRVPE